MSTTIDNFDNLVESTFEHDEPWKDADLLYHLYWNRDMTQSEIADELGCNQPKISRWMNRLDVSSRDSITVSHHIEERDGELGYSKWNDNNTTVLTHQLAACVENDPHEVFSSDVNIHHKTGHKFDNRHENFEILSQGEHMDLHRNGVWTVEDGYPVITEIN